MKIRRWLGTLPLRLKTLFLKSHMEEELNAELQFHLEQQVEELVGRGLSEKEARAMAARSVGGVERQKERCRDVRAGQWLDSLRADVLFGWRQLMKRKMTTAAAVLSLGLAIGACMAAFRLVDALFLRPMPVSHPESLYGVLYDGLNGRGEPARWSDSSYPLFQQMRETVKDQATMVATSFVGQTDLTFGSYQQMEHAYKQNVSGGFFSAMGLQPELGRLIDEEDDRAPGVSRVAVLSYDYWVRRFGRDPKVTRQTFRLGDSLYQIVGVAPKGFTGTEPGTAVDVYFPTMVETTAVGEAGSSWLRLFVRPKQGVALEALRSKMDAVYHTSEQERAKGFPASLRKMLGSDYPRAHLLLLPAGAGISEMQQEYGPALTALGVLVGMVLLIACVNVANLKTGQMAMRAREMALRVSVGAGRGRLVRLVMVESGMLGLMAAGLGLLFAWWAAPFVMERMSTASNPVRLTLAPDWTVAAFGVTLALGVTLLFGLLPALRASAVKPASALKGGEEPHARQRVMHSLIVAQVAFCFVVLFVAGLFGATFHRLISKPLGFTAEHLLLLETVAEQPQSAAKWDALMQQLRNIPGVHSVAMSDWALASGRTENNLISIPGVPENKMLTYFLNISPAWLETMRIPLLGGRDFRESDRNADTAIVNERFAKVYFGGQNPIGKTFSIVGSKTPITIVGVAGDAVYLRLRDQMLPQVYQSIRGNGGMDDPANNIRFGMLIVRTEQNDPMAMAETLRKTIVQTDAVFRVRNTHTQEEMIWVQTIRERMLAALAGFFAVVALLLAAVGLYGVLHYSVVQREREIGVRLALGAAVANIARLVTMRVFAMVCLGAAVGLVAGIASVRFVSSLLYGVKGTDVSMMVLPGMMLLAAVACAAAPAVMRAVRIDPAVMLRAE